LPEGAIARYARRAKLATKIGAIPAFIGDGIRGGARTILLGDPKAAVTGIDAYAAGLGWILAKRGVIVRDPVPLRCLDRVDTVVIDASAMTTGRMDIVDVVTAARGRAADRARERVQRMFDRERPTALARDGRWRLGPIHEIGATGARRVSHGATHGPHRARHDPWAGVRPQGRRRRPAHRGG
jgi:hypothetical protein